MKRWIAGLVTMLFVLGMAWIPAMAEEPTSAPAGADSAMQQETEMYMGPPPEYLEASKPPEWPKGSKVTAIKIEANRVKVAWSRAIDSGDDLYQYWILVNGKQIGEVKKSLRSYVIKGLKPNTVYKIQIAAVDGFGNASDLGPKMTVKTKRK